MDTIILYAVAIVLLLVSFFASKQKTKQALIKGAKSFEGILPQFITILVLIALLLAVFSPETITKFLGAETGALGVVIAAIVGSVTLIPSFVAFPLAGELLHNGAGVMQIAAFVSTLVMVGVIMLPLEIEYFGKRIAIMRNVMAFLFSFIVALFVGWVVGL